MTSPEEFSCIFCKESFESKEELQIHFRKHGDPKFNPSVKNSKGTQSEMSANGEKGEEPEMVRCDVCEEEFPTISKAITHKHKVHPDHDAKYFCPWCGKLFTMKHLYNKHIQSVHESAEQCGDTGFHCDYCEVDFFVPSAMLYHNKFFHRQDTELAAIGHSRKLKMFGQELLQIYYCPFCGEEYFNKVNLHKHMGDDHIDENQCPEDVLRCPLCDAVFYHLDAYELHLTFHSTDEMYGEENEMAKDITEFSLETVPPMMEKVENESQEEEPASTMGIEELLQQAMNESNGETRREKKKKHKKHKKSKNAAITLDEFLNMNSDVFGEGLDVQGIVEVPTQVVAKSLKRKPGPKPLPTELQKLKKAGLVIKKNPAPVDGLKFVNKKPTLRPGIKITSQGNIISNEMKKAAEAAAKLNVARASNDILSKLLNQGNSQIKIVKKTSQGDSISEISATEGPPKIENIMKSPEIDSNTSNKDIKTNDQSSAIKCTEGVPETDSIIENHNDEDNVDNDAAFTCHNSGDHSMMQDRETIPDSKEFISMASNLTQDDNVKESNKELNNTSLTKPKSSATTLDALRNISQHLTIKSLQSTRVKIHEQDDKNIDKSETEHKDEEPDTKPIQKDCQINFPIADKKNKISPLKHLSHLTVKPINQSKNASSPSRKSDDLYEEKEKNHEDLKSDDVDDCDNEISDNHDEDDNISTKTAVLNQPTTLEAFKNLRKHITIKSLSQSPNSPKNTVDKPIPGQSANHDLNDSESGIDTGQVEKQHTINKEFSNKPIVKQTINTKTAKSPLPTHSPKNIDRVQAEKEVQIPKDQVAVKNEITANFLKQFPNITAKPLNVHKTVKQSTIQTSSQSMNVLKGNSVQHNAKKIETREEEIETFNIDDSDDEVLSSPASTSRISLNSKTNLVKNTVPKHEDNKNPIDCKQVLKNLNKHISIKPSNQTAKEVIQDETFSEEDGDSEFTNEAFVVKPQQKNNIVLQNKLKNLSNLTVKSSNISPKLPTATTKQKVEKKQLDEYDSDCSNTSGKIKITELPDDYASDDDVPLKSIKNPNVSNEDADFADYTDSENENKAHQEDDDIESQITSTMLKTSNKPAFLNNLKNITIKSSKDRQMHEDDESPDSADENKVLVPFQPQNKPSRPLTTVVQPEQKPPFEVKQNFGRPVKQNTSNCVNTVNKEVTVQKFQTKTVVQEITTTVTKTIRTINQSVKQEVRNVTQSLVMPTPPQRVQGIRPQIRNFKGTPTRPSAPLMGTKIRNSAPTRLPGHTNIGPSNQLVQVKLGVNLARPNNPRMAGPKRFSQPSTSNSSNPIIRKPLKISPNVMMNKRAATEEASGPFSCFKKPKESLIPLGDEQDTVAHFAASSQMSQSNFTSTTKVMKGNSVVTSTHMKSEMSTSCEQIKKLNNMAGLKVVKSSQMKQASQVEERSNVSSAKRSAIEAIEKLQKQGLLVKKPKVEEPVVDEPDSEHEHSHPEEDEDYCET